MGMTLTQKILAAHEGLPEVKAGQLINAKLDIVLGNDITTPVAINEGVIACEKASTLTEADHDLVFALLDLLGTPVEVETRLLSVAGTVGGCSPAFIAMVIEALADAAVKHGIPRATAYPMVSQMMVGTAKLQLATGMHPGAIKDAVCSHGGTTIRGVAELEAAGMRSAFIRAIDAIEG